MKELIECIKLNSADNAQEIQKCITNMVCLKTDYIELSDEKLLNALKIDGEFLACCLIQ